MKSKYGHYSKYGELSYDEFKIFEVFEFEDNIIIVSFYTELFTKMGLSFNIQPGLANNFLYDGLNEQFYNFPLVLSQGNNIFTWPENYYKDYLYYIENKSYRLNWSKLKCNNEFPFPSSV